MLKQLCYSLVEKGLVKHGSFVLKSGETSSYYVDLKAIVAYPRLLSQVATCLLNLLPSDNAKCVLMGVPYGAIPIATTMSVISGIPQGLLRKEAKAYGTKKRVESVFKTNVILVEDVVTTGTSVLEQCQVLQEEGFVVLKVLCVVDRNGGGRQAIREAGFDYEYLFSVEDLHVSLPVRIRTTSRSDAKPLSRVVLAYDAPIGKEFFNLVETIGPLLAGIKIHSEVLLATEGEMGQLQVLAKEYGLFLWEDRKFTDTANTVKHQMNSHLDRGIDYVTITTLSGTDVLDIHSSKTVKKPVKKLVVAEMSSQGNLFCQPTVSAAIKKQMADNLEGFHGVVCQTTDMIKYAHSLDKGTFVPGISLTVNEDTDNRGQRWRTPDMFDFLPSYFVIGRSLRCSNDPKAALLAFAPYLFL